jgi:hypothetical protein
MAKLKLVILAGLNTKTYDESKVILFDMSLLDEAKETAHAALDSILDNLVENYEDYTQE